MKQKEEKEGLDQLINNYYKKNYNIYLDDVRDPDHSKRFMSTKGVNPKVYDRSWIIVRSFSGFVDLINHYGLPDLISFDHDLGDVDEFGESSTLNGNDCAKWLVEYCIDNNKDLPEYLIHSFNPVGAENIDATLKSFLKWKKK